MDDSSGSASRDRPASEVLAAARRLHGMLVELVVPGTSLDDWARVVGAMAAADLIESFTVDGVEAAREVTGSTFSTSGRGGHRLAARFGGCLWTTSLASVETVDLQCDAEEIVTRWQVEEITSFMRTAANTTGKRALLLPETLDPLETRPLLVVEPDAPPV